MDAAALSKSLETHHYRTTPRLALSTRRREQQTDEIAVEHQLLRQRAERGVEREPAATLDHGELRRTLTTALKQLP